MSFGSLNARLVVSGVALAFAACSVLTASAAPSLAGATAKAYPSAPMPLPVGGVQASAYPSAPMPLPGGGVSAA